MIYGLLILVMLIIIAIGILIARNEKKKNDLAKQEMRRYKNDFLAELLKMPDKDKKCNFYGARMFEVNELIAEVHKESPLGIEHIKLYMAVKKKGADEELPDQPPPELPPAA